MGTCTCLTLGYLLGSLSPSALISKLKNKNLREHGSGNLGATNTMLVFGWSYGILVMVFDVFKAIFASRLARMLFPQLYLAGMLAACGAVIGHIFPFYLKFHGGKGVACFAGLLLTYNIGVFFVLLAMAVTMMIVVDYGVAGPVTAAVLFPVFVAMQTRNVFMTILTAMIGLLIIMKHRENFRNIKNGEEIHLRAFFGAKLQRHCLTEGDEADDNNQ